MDNNFEKFNSLFPSSKYRRIKPGEKAPLNNMLCSYSDVKDDTERVGWIISDGFIVVDIDDMNVAKRIKRWIEAEDIHCCLFTTEHGMHFIFKKCARLIKNSAKCMTYLGIEVDYRVEGKGYIVLPFNDLKREWTRFDKCDSLPEVLCPIIAKPDHDLVGLGEHDGRNDALFKWSVKIRDKFGSADMKLHALNIINKYIFDKPLPDNEINSTLLRDEMKTKILNTSAEKKTAAEKENECVDEMMKDNIFCCVNQNILYMYNGAYYKYIPDREVEVMIATKYAPLFREANRKEVISKLKLFAKQVDFNADDLWSLISFNNCVVDIQSGEMFEPSPELFVTTHVNRNYIFDAPVSERIEEYLNHCSNNDPQKRRLLLEMIGDVFLRRAMFQRMFVIYGEGGTGKSTLLRLITLMVGAENAAFLSTKDLENPFLPSELYGKLVNIGDDLPFTRINDTSQIKKLVSGEAMMIQRKFAQPMWFNNYATMIFTTNKLQNTSDRTSGFMRRLALIDMNTRITNPTGFFAESLTESDFEYLIYIAANSIREALRRGELTRSYVVDRNLEAYQKMQSSLSEFIDDNEITKEYLVNRSTSEVYAEYTHYCQENGMKPLGKHYLIADLCQLFYISTSKCKDELNNSATRFVYVTNKTN